MEEITYHVFWVSLGAHGLIMLQKLLGLPSSYYGGRIVTFKKLESAEIQAVINLFALTQPPRKQGHVVL